MTSRTIQWATLILTLTLTLTLPLPLTLDISYRSLGNTMMWSRRAPFFKVKWRRDPTARRSGRARGSKYKCSATVIATTVAATCWSQPGRSRRTLMLAWPARMPSICTLSDAAP